MNLSNLFLILFAVLATSTYAARMSIVSPTQLALKFTDDIEFATAHFGSVPYGAHLVGNLKLANPIDACEPMEHFAGDSEWTDQTNIVAVVKRGGCRVPLKSRNAQQAGAKILLIVDDRETTFVSEWFGHEHGDDDINIPTLMIQQKPGEEIIKFLQQGQLGTESADPIVILNFPTELKAGRPRLDFWYSAADVFGTSYRFIRHIKQVVKENNLRFVPHWVTWTSGNGKRNNYLIEDPDCLSGGRYCAPDPDDKGPLTGADVVYEDLRQICVNSGDSDIWWEYTREYAKKCLQSDNIRKCGDEALNRIAKFDVVSRVNECIEKSWKIPEGKKTYNEKLDDNLILANQKEVQTEYQINSFPALFVAHKPYYGNLNHLYDILKEACNNMDPLTQQCKNLLGVRDYEDVPISHHTRRVVLVLIVMSLVSFVIFYFCRRMIKRESKDMSMQVGGMVTRYFALKEIKETGGDDNES